MKVRSDYSSLTVDTTTLSDRIEKANLERWIQKLHQYNSELPSPRGNFEQVKLLDDLVEVLTATGNVFELNYYFWLVDAFLVICNPHISKQKKCLETERIFLEETKKRILANTIPCVEVMCQLEFLAHATEENFRYVVKYVAKGEVKGLSLYNFIYNLTLGLLNRECPLTIEEKQDFMGRIERIINEDPAKWQDVVMYLATRFFPEDFKNFLSLLTFDAVKEWEALVAQTEVKREEFVRDVDRPLRIGTISAQFILARCIDCFIEDERIHSVAVKFSRFPEMYLECLQFRTRNYTDILKRNFIYIATHPEVHVGPSSQRNRERFFEEWPEYLPPFTDSESKELVRGIRIEELKRFYQPLVKVIPQLISIFSNKAPERLARAMIFASEYSQSDLFRGAMKAIGGDAFEVANHIAEQNIQVARHIVHEHYKYKVKNSEFPNLVKQAVKRSHPDQAEEIERLYEEGVLFWMLNEGTALDKIPETNQSLQDEDTRIKKLQSLFKSTPRFLLPRLLYSYRSIILGNVEDLCSDMETWTIFLRRLWISSNGIEDQSIKIEVFRVIQILISETEKLSPGFQREIYSNIQSPYWINNLNAIARLRSQEILTQEHFDDILLAILPDDQHDRAEMLAYAIVSLDTTLLPTGIFDSPFVRNQKDQSLLALAILEKEPSPEGFLERFSHEQRYALLNLYRGALNKRFTPLLMKWLTYFLTETKL